MQWMFAVDQLTSVHFFGWGGREFASITNHQTLPMDQPSKKVHRNFISFCSWMRVVSKNGYKINRSIPIFLFARPGFITKLCACRTKCNWAKAIVFANPVTCKQDQFTVQYVETKFSFKQPNLRNILQKVHCWLDWSKICCCSILWMKNSDNKLSLQKKKASHKNDNIDE